jgi:branched-chain amino acid aminotransferase
VLAHAEQARRQTWLDGRLLAAQERPWDREPRALLYGEGAFETVRVVAGRPVRLDAHLARLALAAAALGLDPTAPHRIASEATAAARTLPAGGALRLTLTRDGAPQPIVASDAEATRRLVSAQPTTLPASLEGRSVRSALVPGVVTPWGHKLTSYAGALLALRAARSLGADDAIVHDPKGVVLEGATSNVWASIGGRLLTPPLAPAGLGPRVLAGTTRAVLLAMGLGEEAELSTHHLARADEIFLTSAVRLVAPVRALCVGPGADHVLAGAGRYAREAWALLRAADG